MLIRGPESFHDHPATGNTKPEGRTPIWPPEADALLRAHYHQRRSADIAILIARLTKKHMTANMVIGRAHRLGLSWKRDAPRTYTYDSSEFLQSALSQS